MTDTTRQQWIEACADRYVAMGGANSKTAAYLAEACADSEEAIHGPCVENWDSPADCADEDMSYWGEE